MIESLRRLPWCKGDGGALQPTEAQALPMWVFQRERRVPIIQVLCSVFVPAKFLKIVFVIDKCISCKNIFHRKYCKSPLALEQFCMTIETCCRFQNLGVTIIVFITLAMSMSIYMVFITCLYMRLNEKPELQLLWSLRCLQEEPIDGRRRRWI